MAHAIDPRATVASVGGIFPPVIIDVVKVHRVRLRFVLAFQDGNRPELLSQCVLKRALGYFNAHVCVPVFGVWSAPLLRHCIGNALIRFAAEFPAIR